MTRPTTRLAAALLALGLAPACGRHHSPQAVCQLPAPQPSALPTLPVAAGAGQAQAIHLGVKTAGQTVSFTVPAGTASVTIVEQAASSAVPLTVGSGASAAANTPVPLSIDVAGVGTIFFDVPMPPDAAFRKVPAVTGLTVLDPASDPSLPVYFLSEGAWTGALTVPNTSQAVPGTAAGAGAPAGMWTVTVSDWAYECRTFPALGCTAPTLVDSSYDVTVILKPAAAPASALRVVFYLVTSSGLTAANASANLDLQRLEWAVSWFLGQAGITPTFGYRDVPGDVRLRYATGVDASSGGACGSMDQLLQLAGPGNQLNVFLVDLIKDSSSTGGFRAIGLDPIVPGPGSFGGTPSSGVLVSLENLGKVRPSSAGCPALTPASAPSLDTCGDDRTAFVVAHEAGHFMGLQHTTEAIGTAVDPIADTPTCLCPLCKPANASAQCQGLGSTDPHVASPYQMLVSDCLAPPGSVPECGGGDNLMFWLLDAGSQGTVSADQAAVMRASPLVE